MALVYSYIRFSSKRQAEGDSLRRQTEDGDAWIAANGHTKADLTLQDLGVSAYRGANKHKGALKTFLDLANNGTVPKGSILLIEALDRLSREGIHKANNLFQQILSKGVKIAVLKPIPTVYDVSSLNDPIGTLIPLISFYLASLESKNKAFRIKKDREQKRKVSLESQSPIRTKSGAIEVMSPRWIDWNSHAQAFELNEGSKAIKFIFESIAEGKGHSAVLQELQNCFPAIGTSGRWNSSYLTKVLNDPSVLGDRQHYEFVEVDGIRRRVPVGTPIPNYYPRVISQQLWDRVQARRPGQAPRGRRARVLNLFKGLVINAHDGYPMHVQPARKPDGTIDHRLVSYGHRCKVAGSDPVGVRYLFFERVFLEFLTEISLSDLKPPSTNENTLLEKQQELVGVQKRLADLQELLVDPNALPPKTLLNAARLSEEREQILLEEIEELRSQQVGSTYLVEAQSMVAAASSMETRERLASAISQLVKRIYLKPEKHYGRVWWAALVEFRSGQYKNLYGSPFCIGGMKGQSQSKNGDGLSNAGFAVDITIPEQARSKQLFAFFARMYLEQIELPKTIPNDLLGASEYFLLLQKGAMQKESYKTVPSKIRRFVDIIGRINCSELDAKRWGQYVKRLQKELGKTTARVAINRTKEFCKWLVANGKLAEFAELKISAAKLIP